MESIHNPAKNRFEIIKNDHLARVEYRIREGKMYIMHTKVPDALSGQGIASLLAKAILEHAKTEHLSLVVYCPFVKVYMQRHPEYNNLLVS